MKLIFVAPLAAAILAGAGAGTYLWVTASGTAEEAPLARQEATPTPTPTPKPALTPTPSPTASLVRQPSPQPVPDDWLAYADADIGISLRYPPDWIVERRDFPAHADVPGDVDTYRVDIYRPLSDGLSGKADAGGTDASVAVHIWTGASNNFLEWWTDKCQPVPTTLGGIPADRCSWAYPENPHPSMMAPPEGAYIFYTIHAADGPRYIGAVLYLFDASGNPADHWAPESEALAERVIASAAVGGNGAP